MNDITAILQNYGAWGIVTLQFVVIGRLAAYIKRLHEQQRESDRAVLIAQREETKATITALVETRDALRAFKEAMEVLARQLRLEG